MESSKVEGVYGYKCERTCEAQGRYGEPEARKGGRAGFGRAVSSGGYVSIVPRSSPLLLCVVHK